MRSVGEGFQTPVDIFTGEKIVGAPQMASITNGQRSRGHVIINSTFQNTRPSGLPENPPAIDQPRVACY